MTWRVSEGRADDQGPAGALEAPEQTFQPGPAWLGPGLLPVTTSRRPQPGRGRRSQTMAVARGGHYLRPTRPQGPARDIALTATLRAAALRHSQAAHPPSAWRINPADLRVKIRRSRTGNLILFVVDASGSMGARQRMVAVKGAILSLLVEAYQKRDRVGFIAFRGQGAALLVPPTNSVELAERSLRSLPTGGRTPLAAGLHLAEQTLTHYLYRDAALTPLLVLITDGRANVGSPAQVRHSAQALAHKRIAGLVLDSEQGFVRLGAARTLANWLSATYLSLDTWQAGQITGSIRRLLPF